MLFNTSLETKCLSYKFKVFLNSVLNLVQILKYKSRHHSINSFNKTACSYNNMYFLIKITSNNNFPAIAIAHAYVAFLRWPIRTPHSAQKHATSA